MAAYLALLIGFGLVLWLMREDIKTRRAGSQALLIPGLWVCIQATHPLSFWFTGAEGAGDALFDTALTVAMMVASIVVIKRRGLKWGKLANQNTALFLIYGYFALSAIWSDAPVLSIKRIIKDFGVLPVALVFLTELKPAEAIRVVFVRIAYILFPLSIVAIKWFPAIGRVARNSGDSMFRGLTTHKSSLGLIVFIFGLMLLWDLFEIRYQTGQGKKRKQQMIRIGVLLMGLWLLLTSESKTSLLCLILGATIFWIAGRLAKMRGGKALLIGGLVTAVALATVDKTLGVSDMIIVALGKDPSLTGRTELWDYVKAQKTDPWFGNGFYVFWDTAKGKAVVEEFMQIKSTHNGYLEMYVDGGLCANALLLLALLSMVARAINRLFAGDPMGRLGLVFWVLAVIYNFSESSFFRPDPLWFLLLLVTLGCPRLKGRRAQEPVSVTGGAMSPARSGSSNSF